MRSILLILMVSTATSAWDVSKAEAQRGPSPLQLTIDHTPTAMLGEPISFDIVVANRSSNAIRIDLGDDAIRNIVVTLRTEQGKRFRRELPLSEGVRGPGEFVLGAGEQHRQTILLGKWHDISVPGDYGVIIEFTKDALDTRGRPVFMPRGVTTIHVLPRDETSLARVYQELADTVIHTHDVRRRARAAEALASLKDPMVVAYLEQVLLATNKEDSRLIEALLRIGDAEAVSTLERLALSGEEERRALAQNALERRGRR